MTSIPPGLICFEDPGQEEILSYLVRTAQKYNLYQHVRFNTSVESARWDDESKKWKTKVTTAGGSKEAEFNPEYEITSDFLVSAVGQLNTPRFPEMIQGYHDFTGKLMHSARWDWSYDLTGKRIGIIGNGESDLILSTLYDFSLADIMQVLQQLRSFQRLPK